ncbi:hypothetical protein HAX54_002567, partial [Datura stramonium]|nr:hypothetical protein [Datura stramonium]
VQIAAFPYKKAESWEHKHFTCGHTGELLMQKRVPPVNRRELGIISGAKGKAIVRRLNLVNRRCNIVRGDRSIWLKRLWDRCDICVDLNGVKPGSQIDIGNSLPCHRYTIGVLNFLLRIGSLRKPPATRWCFANAA